MDERSEKKTKVFGRIRRYSPVERNRGGLGRNTMNLQQNIAAIKQILPGNPVDNYMIELDSTFTLTQAHNDYATDLALGHILLTGHSGAGKTYGIEQLAAVIGQGAITVNLNGQTDIHQFLGRMELRGGATVWVDGALMLAIKKGLWLILDEVDFGSEEVLAILNGLGAKAKVFMNVETNEPVPVHPAFRMIGTANTVGPMIEFRDLYPGTRAMNYAFIDRFRIHTVEYMDEATEMRIILDNLIKFVGTNALARNQATKFPRNHLSLAARWLASIGKQLREDFKSGKIKTPVTTRSLLQWGESAVLIASVTQMDFLKQAFGSAMRRTLTNKMAKDEIVFLHGALKVVSDRTFGSSAA